METNDKESFTEKFIRTFPTRIFILCFAIVVIILYAISPAIRNMDYASMPVTHYDWNNLPIQNFSPDKTKVVVIDGFVSGNGKYVNTVPLLYDNVNCIPKNGNHRIAGYWTIEYFNIPKFNAIWIVGGC
jgi:hypothetical protein